MVSCMNALIIMQMRYFWSILESKSTLPEHSSNSMLKINLSCFVSIWSHHLTRCSRLLELKVLNTGEYKKSREVLLWDLEKDTTISMAKKHNLVIQRHLAANSKLHLPVSMKRTTILNKLILKIRKKKKSILILIRAFLIKNSHIQLGII